MRDFFSTPFTLTYSNNRVFFLAAFKSKEDTLE